MQTQREKRIEEPKIVEASVSGLKTIFIQTVLCAYRSVRRSFQKAYPSVIPGHKAKSPSMAIRLTVGRTDLPPDRY